MVDYQTAKESLHRALQVVLEEDIPQLDDSQRMFEDLHLDSTTMLETLLMVDQELELNVDPEELDIDDFLTVESYCQKLVELSADAEVSEA